MNGWKVLMGAVCVFWELGVAGQIGTASNDPYEFANWGGDDIIAVNSKEAILKNKVREIKRCTDRDNARQTGNHSSDTNTIVFNRLGLPVLTRYEAFFNSKCITRDVSYFSYDSQNHLTSIKTKDSSAEIYYQYFIFKDFIRQKPTSYFEQEYDFFYDSKGRVSTETMTIVTKYGQRNILCKISFVVYSSKDITKIHYNDANFVSWVIEERYQMGNWGNPRVDSSYRNCSFDSACKTYSKSVIQKFNKDGKKAETVYLWERGNLYKHPDTMSIDRFVYDTEGRIVQMNSYGEGNKLGVAISYIYNNKGLRDFEFSLGDAKFVMYKYKFFNDEK